MGYICHRSAYYGLFKPLYHIKCIRTAIKGIILARANARSADRRSEFGAPPLSVKKTVFFSVVIFFLICHFTCTLAGIAWKDNVFLIWQFFSHLSFYKVYLHIGRNSTLPRYGRGLTLNVVILHGLSWKNLNVLADAYIEAENDHLALIYSLNIGISPLLAPSTLNNCIPFHYFSVKQKDMYYSHSLKLKTRKILHMAYRSHTSTTLCTCYHKHWEYEFKI